MSVEAILQPYVDAPTLVEAEAELDRLAGRGDELPEPLGDLYDDLAHAAVGRRVRAGGAAGGQGARGRPQSTPGLRARCAAGT